MKKEDRLTAEYVRSILLYNASTGIFTWKARSDVPKKWNTRYAGTLAGRVSNGYYDISIFKTRYRSHRLAWLYMTGGWPKNEIDHKDLNRSNNSWANLREATRGQNAANCPLRSDNTSGVKGVSWDKKRKKWVVIFGLKNRSINLGRFQNIEDAAYRYATAAREHFGEFARMQRR